MNTKTRLYLPQEALFLGIQVCLCALLYYLALQESSKALLCAGVAGILLYPYMAVVEFQREPFLLNPLVMYLTAATFYVGVACLWAFMCVAAGYEDALQLGTWYVSDGIFWAAFFCVLGILFFWGGYKLACGLRLVRLLIRACHVRAFHLRLSTKGWLFIIAAAWIFRWLPKAGVPVNIIGGMYQYLCYLPIMAPFLIITSKLSVPDATTGCHRNTNLLFLAIVTGLLEIFFHAYGSGMRIYVIDTIFLLLWALFLNEALSLENVEKSRITILLRKAPLLLLAAIFIFGFVLPYGKTVLHKKKIDFSWDQMDFSRSFPKEGIWSVGYRTALGSVLAVATCYEAKRIANTPPGGHVGEKILLGLIPRIIWPNKPYVSQGAQFTVFLGIGGANSEREATTSTGMSAIGELYWSAGAAGVIGGMLLIGFLFSFSYQVFSYCFFLNPFRALVMLLLVLLTLQCLENEATSYFIFFAYMWLVFWPLSQLLVLVRPRSEKMF